MIRFNAIVIFLAGLITFLMFPDVEARSQYTGKKPFDKIFDLIYNQKFGEAETELRTSEAMLEKWGYQLLLLDLHWWKAISGNSEEDYQNFESVLNESSARLNNQVKGTPDILLYGRCMQRPILQLQKHCTQHKNKFDIEKNLF